jgi:hypothetical protein
LVTTSFIGVAVTCWLLMGASGVGLPVFNVEPSGPVDGVKLGAGGTAASLLHPANVTAHITVAHRILLLIVRDVLRGS